MYVLERKEEVLKCSESRHYTGFEKKEGVLK